MISQIAQTEEPAMRILLVGATGFVGGAIRVRLQKAGLPFAALIRQGRTHPKAHSLAEAGVEIIEGDLARPASLGNAVKNIDTVISTVSSMPSGTDDGLRRVDLEGTLALIESAERTGVKRFVYISYSGNIREESPLETAKRKCESRLLESAMDTVILRPSYFVEVWLSPALGFDPANGSARIYGTGEAKVSYISGTNVADFAVKGATRKHSEKSTILELGGPEPLSQLEAVRIFERHSNKQIKADFVPVEALEAQHNSSDPLQKTFAALMLAYAKGDVVKGSASLAHQYEIQLRSVSDYARDLCACE
jgi:NADH dehydrogenase